MRPSDTQFPARPLFTAVAMGMGHHHVAFAGPTDPRAVSACSGGHFTGPRMQGVVVAEHSNEWRLRSAAAPSLCLVEGLITLRSDDGQAVLVTYRGRASDRYGPQSCRVGLCFETGPG